MYFIVPPSDKRATGMGGSLEVGEHLRERGSSRVSSKVLSFSNIRLTQVIRMSKTNVKAVHTQLC